MEKSCGQMYSRLRVPWKDSMWPFCWGVLFQMNFSLMPRWDAAFRNFLPAYWEPLSYWMVSLEQSGLAVATAYTSESTATSAVARVSNR